MCIQLQYQVIETRNCIKIKQNGGGEQKAAAATRDSGPA